MLWQFRYLGLSKIMFFIYGKFISDLSTKLYPLHALLKDGVKWNWYKEFYRSHLIKEPVLVHYDPKLPVRLAGDTLNYGIGAVLSHVDSKGQEHLIAFTSQALSTSEKNYSPVAKEALSLIFGITKFQNYIYGRHFTLVTDHHPLTALFGPKNEVLALAAGSLRWALLLSSYNYTIEFRSTKAHANARLPLPTKDEGESLSEVSVFNVSQINTLSVSVVEMHKATCSDPILSKVYYHLQKH